MWYSPAEQLVSEELLVRRLAWLFRNIGYVVAMEVPVATRLADVYCVHPGTGTTIAIEAKLRDWGRALRQAQVYKLAADFSYIALPQQAISDDCVAACSAQGIGAIGLPKRGRARLVLAATPSHHQQPVLVQRALSYVGPRIGLACLYARGA